MLLIIICNYGRCNIVIACDILLFAINNKCKLIVLIGVIYRDKKVYSELIEIRFLFVIKYSLCNFD